MIRTRWLEIVRYGASVAVTAMFMAPLIWWALTSLKPPSAIFDKDRVVVFDFTPTLQNYAITLGGNGPEALSARQAFIDSTLIAILVTVFTILLATMAGFALSRLTGRLRSFGMIFFLIFRIMPPIALIIPAVSLSHAIGLFDTRMGVVAMQMMFTLPVASLMLASFFDDIPREVDEAARLDGASEFNVLIRIAAPMIQGGIAATAILCFMFSWTEFLMALFMSVSFRTLPVMLSILSMGMWGPLAALGTAAMVPAFMAILLVQKHLARGLTMGLQK